MNKLLDGVKFTNAITAFDFDFTPATLDLIGSPCVGRCGPLITPNLYTPPGVALTVCDTVPFLTSYSVTLNTTTGTLAGEINEAYVYIKDNVLMLYAGKKVGDLTADLGVAGAGRRSGRRLCRGRAAGADGQPDQQVVLRGRHVGYPLGADLGHPQVPERPSDQTTGNKLTLNGDNGGLKPRDRARTSRRSVSVSRLSDDVV